MGKVKQLRLFIVEEICKEHPLVDIDKAYVMADALWDEAMIEKRPRSQRLLNKYIKKFQGRA